MRELDSAQVAEVLGLSRSHFVDRVSKRKDFPKPSTNTSRKNRRWPLEAVLRFKQGK
jgi:predicted DNA-binding transcriptional regulator AlpA